MADHREQPPVDVSSPGEAACLDQLRAAVVDAARDWHAAHRPHLHHNPTVRDDRDRACRRADTARALFDAVAGLDGIDDYPLTRGYPALGSRR